MTHDDVIPIVYDVYIPRREENPMDTDTDTIGTPS